MHIRQLLLLLKSFVDFLHRWTQKQDKEMIVNVDEFLLQCGIDNVNIWHISRFLQSSQLPKKVLSKFHYFIENVVEHV